MRKVRDRHGVPAYSASLRLRSGGGRMNRSCGGAVS
jgi:hypothetical protein